MQLLQFFADPIVINCSFIANQADEGGAIHREFPAAEPTKVVNCLFADNVAIDHGGAIDVSGLLEVHNCTFTRNSAALPLGGGQGGGAIWIELGDATITDSILWNNFPNQIQEFAAGTAHVTYSDIEEPWPGDGNISSEPLFEDPLGNNFRLSAGSPCIDAGDNTAVPPDDADLDYDGATAEPMPVDLDGLTRFRDDLDTPDSGNGTPPLVDMGAYESVGPCPWDCQTSPDETVGVQDFLAMLAQWGSFGTSCDFGVGAPGVGINEFLKILANWGSCPESTAPPPPTIEEVVEEADLDYPEDWDEFVDVVTDPEVSEEVKANYRCWIDHYLDCHRRPFCFECVWCQICPDDDPYGQHP
jgi:hypothetical protein